MGQTAGLHRIRRPGLSLALLALLLLLPTGWLAAESSGIQPEVVCPPCDDFNACTVDSCDTAFGTCRHTPLNCNDGNPCTTDSCTPGQFSTCQHTGLPLGTACDDHNSCSLADVCNGSQQCVGSFLPVGSSCNDGNGCTTSDTCRGGGVCRGDFLNAGDSCDDGSLCTSGETCVDEAGSLVCQGPSSCNDSNPCTQDQCDESTGLCAHPPVSCEDGNSCTGDACNPSSGGCTRTFVGGTCNDGDVCTTPDACTNGNCIGAPRDCDDGVACTSNSCDRNIGGCDNTIPIPGACDDGNPCSSDICTQFGCRHQPIIGACSPEDKCLAPMCRLGTCGGLPIDCIDGNACTQDFLCNHSTGCIFPPLSCDDHDACTVDSCNPQTGCAHAAISCDDGIACTVDFCDLSGCGHAPNCDDLNACTMDVCDASGCSHLPIPGVPPGAPLTIQVSLTPMSLSPANHRMVPVTATVTPSDSCGGALSVRLESITSSEPDDAEGSGDGHTTNDIQGAAYGTADFAFALRAERDREGPGRTYRVTYSATDSLGRAAAASAVVVVPVGHGKGPKGTGGGVPDKPDSDDPGAPKKGGGPGRN